MAHMELFVRYGMDEHRANKLLLNALKDDKSHLWCAIDEDSASILGCAWTVEQGAFARSEYLRLIVVAPNSQSKGIGRKLIEHIEFENKLQKRQGLFLLVTADNQDAKEFYNALGFHYIGSIPSYVKENINEDIYYKKL